jgi:hypothetical protein
MRSKPRGRYLMSTLRHLADGLAVLDHPDFSMMGLQIGTRTTLVRLEDGTWLLHSPGNLSAEAIAEVRALGEVSNIVAANGMHHLFLAKASAAFPQARVLAAPTVKAKNPDLRIDEVLGRALPAAFDGALEMARFDGADPLDEYILWHASSRTLVTVDALFYLPRMTGLTKFGMMLNGVGDRPCVSRLARTAFIKDHGAAGRSLDRMLARWDVERVILAHGDVIETGGADALREAWSFAKR